MLTGKQFVAKLAQDNEALFQAGALNVQAYFDSQPSKQELVDHFIGRMVNERMNMSEISARIAQMPASTSVEELTLLTKQAQDEAKHFGMVKDVIEHITGEKLDVEAAIAAEQAKPTAKGAALLAKYEAETDAVALATYQFIAEGRAERNWDTMAACISDEFISSRYAKIARDEGFHAQIGALKLVELCEGNVEVQAKVEQLAAAMRKDLFAISCANSKATAEAKELVAEAYGW
jgi:rubrerythrin